MMFIEPGRTATFILLITYIGVLLYFIYRAKKGKVPNIRRIAGLDALEEVVGRATETGRPIHFTTGMGFLAHAEGSQTLAGISVLGHLARLTARTESQLIVTVMNPEIIPMTEAVVETAYRMEGKPEAYRPEMIRFISSSQQSYVSGAIGLMHRERIAANVMIGPFFAETLQLIEAAARVGAVQVGGTARIMNLAFMVAACDYVLIGEEIYAAGAYVSKEPVLLGSIAAQDLYKYLAIALVSIGAILLNLGHPIFKSLLRM
jgi:hypothetical protein